MLDALLGFIFDIVLSAVGTVIAKVCGVEDPAEFAPAVIGLGFIGIAVAIAVWGY